MENPHKFYSSQKYQKNSKYNRHTGVRIGNYQRWQTSERHWRKSGKLAKGERNVHRRKTIRLVLQEQTGKIPKINHKTQGPFMIKTWESQRATAKKVFPKLRSNIQLGNLTKQDCNAGTAFCTHRLKYYDKRHQEAS